jgi:hypothetical protein
MISDRNSFYFRSFESPRVFDESFDEMIRAFPGELRFDDETLGAYVCVRPDRH